MLSLVARPSALAAVGTVLLAVPLLVAAGAGGEPGRPAVTPATAPAASRAFRFTTRETVVAELPAGGGTYKPSPDFTRLAAAVKVGDRVAVMLDGAEQGRHEKVDASRMAFSADGRHLAYAAADGGRWYVVKDGTRLGRPGGYDAVRPGSVVLSDHGERSAFVARVGRFSVVVVDGRDVAGFDEVSAQNVVLSPDGLRAGCVGRRGDKNLVVVDGRETEIAKDCEYVLSPGCDHFAYRIGPAAGGVVVDGVAVDDRRAGPLGGTMNFAPDGRRCAFVATYQTPAKGGRAAFVDGKAGDVYDGIPGSPVFSPDGRHVAYAARDGRAQFVVVDGKPGPRFRAAVWDNPRFSPDGRHVAYNATDSYDDIPSPPLVVNGQTVPGTNGVLPWAWTGPSAICGLSERPLPGNRGGFAVVRLEIDVGTAD